MKSLNRIKWLFNVSLCAVLTMLFCCNASSNMSKTSGTKEPKSTTPGTQGNSGSSGTTSPNEEANQHKIDSIKQSKNKPKDPPKGKRNS